ncbi:hypothetical protein FIBSPDRAFT_781724, partial [Athelia psychrophila]
MSVYLLMDWMHSGSSRKSVGEVDRLAKVLSHPEFTLEDISGFSARKQNNHFDAFDDQGAENSEDQSRPGDGWKHSTVEISIPTGEKDPSGNGHSFTVHGLHHRPLLGVMKAAVADASSRWFHYFPFRRFWDSPSGERVRVYDEAYTSDVWLKAHDDLQKQPNEPGCKLEKVILGLMFWSDSTHLTSFGSAKIWPVYMYFGNLSKYTRSKPSCGAAHHVAYIPPLPDHIGDEIPAGSNKSTILTHCRRSLFQAVWGELLDPEFVHCYEHGFTGMCSDGIVRRFYPRIFSYSADYPEKILIAGIRHMGKHPCPRCFVKRSDCDKIGLAADTAQRQQHPRLYTPWLQKCLVAARELMYKCGRSISSVYVQAKLAGGNGAGHGSWHPVLNIFAERLGHLGLNPYSMLVVDLLHEFELGVWKYVFVHLIRLLGAACGAAARKQQGEGPLPPGSLVDELDKRYRLVPSFGRSTIRAFATNASAMKKLAARDFEDLLQCAIPVFEGLLPGRHNDIVLTLIFRLAEWHALAKLRMATETTRAHIGKTTVQVGKELRRFRDDTCAAFTTVALPREEAAHSRQKARSVAKKAAASHGVAGGEPESPSPTPDQTGAPVKSRRSKKPGKVFDLQYSKTHNLPDYAHHIRDFGTTDSFSSQVGELEHRRSKGFFPRTSKKNYHLQMTKLERRATRLMRTNRTFDATQPDRHPHHPPFSENDRTPTAPDGERYHMVDCSKHYQDLFSFDRGGDPASKNHILGRRIGSTYDGDEQVFTSEDHNSIIVVGNRVYSGRTLKVNYTTYDVRRGQDIINPRNNCDVMVASPETSADAHRFWYARVLGIFYVYICDNSQDSNNRARQRYDFLWVRWFGMVEGHRHGLRVARLPKVGFIKEGDATPAFGFLDPSLVVRACHLIPAFNLGKTTRLLSPTTTTTAARAFGELEDWMAFYVNIFADRDMFMREVGQGVGHFAFHQDDDHASTEEETDEEMEDIIRTCGVTGEDGHDEDSDQVEDDADSDGEDEDEDEGSSDEDEDAEDENDISDDEPNEDFDEDEDAE